MNWKLNVDFAERIPESNKGVGLDIVVSAVTECGAPSANIQVTVSPAATLTVIDGTPTNH